MNRMMPSIFISLLVLAPYLLQLIFSTYYIPGPDEAYQLQGSLQMALGNGFVSSNNASALDLAKPELSWITGWPIAYALIIYIFQYVGLDPLNAAKVFQISVVVMGVLAWAKLLSLLDVGGRLRLVFLSFLWIQFMSWGIYSTNAFTWAVLPLVFSLAICYRETRYSLLAAGVLCAVLVLFRFQNVILIPAGILAIISLNRFSITIKTLRDAASFAVVPALSFLLILFINRTQSGSGTFLSQIPIDIGWNSVWVIEVMRAFLLGSSFRADEVIGGVLTKFGIGQYANLMIYFVSAVGFLGAIFIYLKCRSAENERFNVVEVWFLSFFLCLVGMLFGLAIFMGVENIPIGRYYHSIFPYFMLLMLCALWRMSRSANYQWLNSKVSFFSLAAPLFGFLVVGGYSVFRYNLSSDFFHRRIAVDAFSSELKRKTKTETVLVFADQMFPHFALKADVNVLIYPTELRSGSFRVSRPVLVILVHDLSNPKPQFPPMTDIRDLAARYDMEVIDKPEFIFAWRVLDAKVD